MINNSYIRGNAFFLILIGIFLLGGITILVTRTSSTTEDTGSTEQASITASKIIGWASEVENAIDILRQRGCSESEISGWYDSNGDGSENGSDTGVYNATSPTNRSCHLYDPKGAGLQRKGGLSYAAFQDIGAADNDLYFWIETLPGSTAKISKALCEQINKQLKTGLDIAALPDLTGLAGNEYSGVITGSTTYGDVAGESAMAGMRAACVLDGTDYVFYRVVLTR